MIKNVDLDVVKAFNNGVVDQTLFANVVYTKPELLAVNSLPTEIDDSENAVAQKNIVMHLGVSPAQSVNDILSLTSFAEIWSKIAVSFYGSKFKVLMQFVNNDPFLYGQESINDTDLVKWNIEGNDFRFVPEPQFLYTAIENASKGWADNWNLGQAILDLRVMLRRALVHVDPELDAVLVPENKLQFVPPKPSKPSRFGSGVKTPGKPRF